MNNALELTLIKLNKIGDLDKFDQLQLLKEVLPELTEYKEDLQTQLTQHLIKFAPCGRNSLNF
ncbi:hypothetical protein ABCL23_003678 [Vibrio cholerae]|uniref:hypothetical protein n=1 Tax=Vibrio cholerae TaxID=666 RepID=UPI002270E1F2|nr:hypothetical protein [Vibrio cholerae]MCX9440060.1 hypothetical protein [Vibrio cholerae]HDI3164459.1 hypothetical protein [Vibrio cholerae]